MAEVAPAAEASAAVAELSEEEQASMAEYVAAIEHLRIAMHDEEFACQEAVECEAAVEFACKREQELSDDASKAQRETRKAKVKQCKEQLKVASAAAKQAGYEVKAARARLAAAADRDLQLRDFKAAWTELCETKGFIDVPPKEHGILFDGSDIRFREDITHAEEGSPGTGRRLQGHLTSNGRIAPSIKELQKGVHDFMHRRRWLRMATGKGKHAYLVPKETRALQAVPASDANVDGTPTNCPKQARHADSADRNSLRDEPWGDVPKVALLFPEGGKLHVYPFDEEGEKTLTVEPGHMIIFRGDLGHAGAAYSVVNVRGHVYLDSVGVLPRKTVNGETATFPF